MHTDTQTKLVAAPLDDKQTTSLTKKKEKSLLSLKKQINKNINKPNRYLQDHRKTQNAHNFNYKEYIIYLRVTIKTH